MTAALCRGCTGAGTFLPCRLMSPSCSGSQPGLSLLRTRGCGPQPRGGSGTPMGPQAPGHRNPAACSALWISPGSPQGPPGRATGGVGASAGKRVLPLFLFEKQREQQHPLPAATGTAAVTCHAWGHAVPQGCTAHGDVPRGRDVLCAGMCHGQGCAVHGAVDRDVPRTAGMHCAECHLPCCHGPAGIPWYGRLCRARSRTKATAGMHHASCRALCPRPRWDPGRARGTVRGASPPRLRPHGPPRPLSRGRAACAHVMLSCTPLPACPAVPGCLPSPGQRREPPAHSLSLSPVSFVDCGEQRRAVYLSDDMRFKVSRDGVVSATRPLQLQQREISFSVHTWDTAGKKHSARVTLRRRGHHHHRHHRHHQQQVKRSPSPQGHRSPSPQGRLCGGFGKVLAPS